MEAMLSWRLGDAEKSGGSVARGGSRGNVKDTAAEVGRLWELQEIRGVDAVGNPRCGLWAAGPGGQLQTVQLAVQASQPWADRRKTVST